MASKKRIAALHAILSADIADYKSQMKAASVATKATQGEIASSFSALSTSTNSAFTQLQQKQRATFAAMKSEAASLQASTASMSRGITAEISSMAAGMTKQLNAVNFGKALMSGFGIGSAIQVIDLVGQKFISIWRESEEHARKLEQRAKSIHDIMGRVAQIRMQAADAARSPEEKIAARRQEISSLMSQMQALDKRRSESLANIEWARKNSEGVFGGLNSFKGTPQGEKFAEPMRTRPFADMMAERADEAQRKWAELGVRLAEARTELAALNREASKTGPGTGTPNTEDSVAARINQEMARISASDQQRTQQEYGAYYEGQWKSERDTSDRRAKQEQDILKVMDDIEAESYERGLAEYGRIAESEFRITEDGNKKKEDSMRRSAAAVSQMWESAADRTGQALTAAFFDSEMKAKDLALSISRMIAEMALRLAIVNPVMNTMFGLSGTANALPTIAGARADGGPMHTGQSYLVGEFEPEIVTARKESMVIPGHKLAGASGGGNTYNIDARGADVGAVARLERSLVALAGPGVVEKRALGAVSNERRRGGGMGRGLGS